MKRESHPEQLELNAPTARQRAPPTRPDSSAARCVRAYVCERGRARESAAVHSAAFVVVGGGGSNAELERRREAWESTPPRFLVLAEVPLSRAGCELGALRARPRGSPASSLTSGPVQVRAVRARSAGGRTPSLARVSPPPLLTLTARSPW
ncbi:hypothetical protein MTO96_052167 [Rhipicephalus appendiculatus]